MDDRKLVGVGIAGAAAAAVCCFTPLLVALLAAVGLSAAVGWLDYVLVPALIAFPALIAYGLLRMRRATARTRRPS